MKLSTSVRGSAVVCSSMRSARVGGVLQNKAKVKRIQEIFAFGQDVERRILFCSESEEVTLSVEGSVIHELAGLGLTNIIGGQVVQHPKVRRIAEAMRERLDRFRAEFVAR